MKEFGTFFLGGTPYRILGIGMPQHGDLILGLNNRDKPDHIYVCCTPDETLKIIIERVEKKKPPCEHENAVRVSYAKAMWACGQCGLAFSPETFVMKDSLGIKRRWRKIAAREPAFGELYLDYRQGRKCVVVFDGGSYSRSDVIVRPADEVS